MARVANLSKTLVCCACAFCSIYDAPCTAPCSAGLAFTITVTSSSGGTPVPGAYVLGDPIGADGTSCNQAPDAKCCDQAGGNTTCNMLGYGGTYTVQIGAPGFQSTQRTITVATGQDRCCPGPITAHLYVSLNPIT